MLLFLTGLTEICLQFHHRYLLTNWLTFWLPQWLAGWLAGWLADWLAG